MCEYIPRQRICNQISVSSKTSTSLTLSPVLIHFGTYLMIERPLIYDSRGAIDKEYSTERKPDMLDQV